MLAERTSSLALFPYTTLFRSAGRFSGAPAGRGHLALLAAGREDDRFLARARVRFRRPPPDRRRRRARAATAGLDRKSTRLNSSHMSTSYAVSCLKKTTTRVRI